MPEKRRDSVKISDPEELKMNAQTLLEIWYKDAGTWGDPVRRRGEANYVIDLNQECPEIAKD
jgi:hypothetical protein